MKILLVDDSRTMRIIQKRSLQKLFPDLTVFEANNGKEAISTIVKEEYSFDFVMCDINMPIMTGLETLKAIRSQEQSKDIPVIMCTSVADKAQVLEALKCGANDYIIKPFKHEDIETKVKAVLERLAN